MVVGSLGKVGGKGGFTASSPLLRFIPQLIAQQLVDAADGQVSGALSLPPDTVSRGGEGVDKPTSWPPGEQALIVCLLKLSHL